MTYEQILAVIKAAVQCARDADGVVHTQTIAAAVLKDYPECDMSADEVALLVVKIAVSSNVPVELGD